MAGRGGETATSLRALRSDLMDALRTCSAEIPSPEQRQRAEIARKVAEYLHETNAGPAQAAVALVCHGRDIPLALADNATDHQTWSTFRPNISREPHHAIDLIARCFAVPEMAALCHSGLRAITRLARHAPDQKRPSRHRIKASRLARMKPSSFDLAKA